MRCLSFTFGGKRGTALYNLQRQGLGDLSPLHARYLSFRFHLVEMEEEDLKTGPACVSYLAFILSLEGA